jgi:hypothetical protein
VQNEDLLDCALAPAAEGAITNPSLVKAERRLNRLIQSRPRNELSRLQTHLFEIFESVRLDRAHLLALRSTAQKELIRVYKALKARLAIIATMFIFMSVLFARQRMSYRVFFGVVGGGMGVLGWSYWRVCYALGYLNGVNKNLAWLQENVIGELHAHVDSLIAR